MMDVTPSSTSASAPKPAQAESKNQPEGGPLDARFINKNLSQSAGGPPKQSPANQKPSSANATQSANQKPPSANATQSANQNPPTLQSGSANKAAQSNPNDSDAANVSAANKRKMTSEPSSPDSPKKGKSSEPVKVSY